MPYLIVRQPGRVPVSVALRDGFRIGRDEQNDLVLDDAQASREHAIFIHAGKAFEVRDLGSRHGLFVNGQKVTAQPVVDGDEIQIGNALLQLAEGDEPATLIHHVITEAGPPERRIGADRRLRLLYDTSRAIGAMGDIEAMLAELLEATIEVFGCERALVGLGGLDTGITKRVTRNRAAGSVGEVVLSRSLLEAILARREAVIVCDTRQEARFATMRETWVLSAMAVPVGAGPRPRGLLYVDDRRQADRFEVSDLELLTALGHLVSVALEWAERCRKAEILAEALETGPAHAILGQSAVMLRLKTEIAKYAVAGRTHVLIAGESGSGKSSWLGRCMQGRHVRHNPSSH